MTGSIPQFEIDLGEDLIKVDEVGEVGEGVDSRDNKSKIVEADELVIEEEGREDREGREDKDDIVDNNKKIDMHEVGGVRAKNRRIKNKRKKNERVFNIRNLKI